MGQKEEKGSAEPKAKYIWDPKKIAWVETTEVETEEPSVEEAAVKPAPEKVSDEVSVGTPSEEGAAEVPEEIAPRASAEVPAEAGGLPYKGAWSRLLALIIDLVVLLIVLMILSTLFGRGAILNTAEGQIETYVKWQQWAVAAFTAVYFVGFWTWRGQTPGKMVTGARIVKKDGSRIGIVRALVRFVIYFAYLLIWAVASSSILVFVVIVFVVLLMIGLSRKKRGLHDWIAGTVVINSRPKKAPLPVEAEASDISETAEPSGTSEPEPDKQE